MTVFNSNHDSNDNSIIVDGIHFETVMPERVVSIPPNLPDAKTEIQFGIRITNSTAIQHKFLLFFLQPEFLNVNRKKVPLHGPNVNGVDFPQTFDFREAIPGESLTFLVRGWFDWQNCHLVFVYPDKSRACWFFRGFTPGIYSLRVIYQNPFSIWNQHNARMSDIVEVRDVWTGQVSTPLVEIELVKI